MQNSFDHPTADDDARRKRFELLPDDTKRLMVDHSHKQANLENGPSLYQQMEKETDPQKKEELEKAIAIIEAVKAEGGKAYVVGGYVRDIAMQRMGREVTPDDIDIEVYGVELDRLLSILRSYGAIREKSNQF